MNKPQRGSALYVPDLPTVISDPMCTGQGSRMTHVVTCWSHKKGGKLTFTHYRPNTTVYPQYKFIIQMYIDNVLNPMLGD